MILYNVVCPKCASHDVFMTKYATKAGIQIGIYCDRCLRWIKWANKQEKCKYEEED